MTPPDEAVTRERERWFSDAEDNAYREEMHAGMERGDPRHDEFSRAAAERILGSLRPGGAAGVATRGGPVRSPRR